MYQFQLHHIGIKIILTEWGNWETTVTGKVPCLPLIHLYTRHTLLFECSSYHWALPFPPKMSAPTWMQMHTELPKTLVSCESSPEIPTHHFSAQKPTAFFFVKFALHGLFSFLEMVNFQVERLLWGFTSFLWDSGTPENISKSCPLSLSIISASCIIFSVWLTSFRRAKSFAYTTNLHRSSVPMLVKSRIADSMNLSLHPPQAFCKSLLGLLLYNNVNSMQS